MEQAIIITAYKNFDHLEKLVRSLSNDFNIYIHIDKKSKIEEKEVKKIKCIATTKKCAVNIKYSINWGGYNHLNAIIDLLQEAYEDKNEYFHIISGEDFPVISSKEIFEFGNRNKEKIYMSYKKASELGKNIINRYKYFYLTDYLDYKKRPRIKKYVMLLIHKLLKLERNNIGNFTESKIYKGLVYVSLSREAVKYVFDYINKDRNYLNELKTCSIAEEFFFQTILMNSPLKDNVIPNNLRYINWMTKHGSGPAILDEDDYENIKNGKYLFMRKIGEPSRNLLKMLKIDYEE